MKIHYLSFYRGVSAHLLTVLYQMILRPVQEYGSLGVILVLWIVLGGVRIRVCCFGDADFASSPKVMYLSIFGSFLPIF